ncbi:unnamed protein product [Closterium sp. Naga37s-1]|nr:unnamed protein product [Closterium sp. Naga37s-1]
MFPSSRAAPPLPSPCSPPPSPLLPPSLRLASPLLMPCSPPPPPFCPASPLPPPCFPPPSAMLPPSLYSAFPRPQPSSLVHTLCLSTPSCSCSFHPTCQEHSGSESESVEEDEEEARMRHTPARRVADATCRRRPFASRRVASPPHPLPCFSPCSSLNPPNSCPASFHPPLQLPYPPVPLPPTFCPAFLQGRSSLQEDDLEASHQGDDSKRDYIACCVIIARAHSHLRR